MADGVVSGLVSHDGVVALAWAVLVWTASFLGFLLTRPLLLDWEDQGYALARLTGPFLLGLLTWLLVGIGQLPLTPAVALLALGLLALAAALVAWQWRERPLPAWRTIVSLDVALMLGVGAFGLVRVWSPSIAGAERPMDHALLAAMLGQHAVLPEDPWLAGAVVNYHVAGHAWWAPFGVLLGKPPWIVYNLVLVTVPAQLLAGAWAVGGRLQRHWAWTAAVALVLAGPWSAGVILARTGLLPVGLGATRVVPGTINEYPFFSLTWGDLHAHVLALPLLVLLVALLVRLQEDRVESTPSSRPRSRIGAIVALAASVGTTAVLTSSWDLVPVTLGAVWALYVVVTRAPRLVLPLGVVTLAVVLVTAWPVLSTFRPPHVATGWEWQGSPLLPFLAVVGTWLAPPALVAATGRWSGASVVLCAGAAITLSLVPELQVRVLLVVVALGLWRRRQALGPPGTALALSAIALLLLAECVWVDDVYGWDLRRVNTVFKWHLHAIVLLALALPICVHVLWNDARPRVRGALRVALVTLALCATVGPIGVVAERWRQREPARTLSGLMAMEGRWPGDAAVVSYLWRHAAPHDVVLEASGHSYTYASRIAFMTGRPTLLGWIEHERLWRRGPAWTAAIDARASTVAALYVGLEPDIGQRLLDEHVRFIVVGPVERRRYPGLTVDRFRNVADVVVDQGGTVLLRVR